MFYNCLSSQFDKLIKLLVILSFFAMEMYGAEVIKYGKGTYGHAEIVGWEEGSRVSVGKYCSIASGVVIVLGGKQSGSKIATSSFPKVKMKNKNSKKKKERVIIGNDVWLGLNSFILGGVTIGDGAVVGAGAVVSKNVPPYAIVAGNPAKIIRYRFEPQIIQKLITIAWWNWSEDKIKSAMGLLLSNEIDQFIKKYE